MSKREHILGLVQDLVSDFMYYDRKGDEDLSSEEIQEAFYNGDVTVNEVVEEFRYQLERGTQ